MTVRAEPGVVRGDERVTAVVRARRPRWVDSLGVAVVVLLAASPVVVAALSLVGDTWHPVGDWASMLFRTSQVGSRDTPLIGAYTVKGWAHPGPFLFWAAAPLYHLTGGDPRSLEWTGAVLNSLTVGAIGLVAWRRGRWPLLLGLGLLVALLVHGIGPARLVDLWNPFLGIMPFLLAVLLAWDASLGRRSSLVLAAVPASIAIQCHVAFGVQLGLVAVWFVAWSRWWRRLVPEDRLEDRPDDLDDDGTPPDIHPPTPPWAPWRTAARDALIVTAVLWLPPLVDLVVDTHNLASVAGHLLIGSGTQIGLPDGWGLVSRYVRPDGPWMGGAEPTRFFSVQGSGPVPAVLVLLVLAACLVVARRRRWIDVAALSTLTIVLVVGSIPATANLVAPAFDYLTQWLKVVGALVWFTVGWTAWRLAAPHLLSSAGRRVGAATLAGLAVVGGAAWSWGEASRIVTPVPFEGRVVQDLRAQVDDVLPADRRYRVQMSGDLVSNNGPGLIYYMIEDGYDVVTRDGAQGLKWGHAHRWSRGDPFDVSLTVAVHYPGRFWDAYQDCLDDGDVELVASHDELTAAERRELGDLRFRAMAGTLTEADEARVRALEEDNFRVGVFAGDSACATRDPTIDRSED